MSGIKIENCTADGHIAAGDINIHEAEKKSPLRKVIEQLKKDCIHDPDFNQLISDFLHYTNPVHPDHQRDLKTKLDEADRSDELHEAEELKERFTKQLVKNSLSEHAQNAYVHILSKLKIDYVHKVKPLLKEGSPLSAIEEKVHEIVAEVYDDLAGTVLEQNMREIKGMLYYLTGNCHIEWKY